MRSPFPQLIYPSKLHGFVHPSAHLFSRYAQVFEAESHIFLNGKGKKLILRVLEDKTNVPCEFKNFMFDNVQSCDSYAACEFPLIKVWNESIEASAKSCFSTAAWTCNEGEFPFLYFYGDVYDCRFSGVRVCLGD